LKANLTGDLFTLEKMYRKKHTRTVASYNELRKPAFDNSLEKASLLWG